MHTLAWIFVATQVAAMVAVSFEPKQKVYFDRSSTWFTLTKSLVAIAIVVKILV